MFPEQALDAAIVVFFEGLLGQQHVRTAGRLRCYASASARRAQEMPATPARSRGANHCKAPAKAGLRRQMATRRPSPAGTAGRRADGLSLRRYGWKLLSRQSVGRRIALGSFPGTSGKSFPGPGAHSGSTTGARPVAVGYLFEHIRHLLRLKGGCSSAGSRAAPPGHRHHSRGPPPRRARRTFVRVASSPAFPGLARTSNRVAVSGQALKLVIIAICSTGRWTASDPDAGHPSMGVMNCLGDRVRTQRPRASAKMTPALTTSWRLGPSST